MKRNITEINNSVTSMKNLKRQDGFTLIEVLIGITIFAVGLLAIAALQTSAIQMNSRAGQVSNLTTWGMDQIEQLMAVPYTSGQLDPVNSPFGPVNQGEYTIGYTVQNDANIPNSKQISVTVTKGNEQLTLTAIRSESYGKNK
jgi:prepilin-type N-terminal cleavage/methylation domain-containing protein